ncbi:MAG: hypothetical protein V1898_05150 [Patescibacteria group bacterium]
MRRIILLCIIFIGFSLLVQPVNAAVIEAKGWGWIGLSAGSSGMVTPGLISFNCDNLNGYYGSSSCGGTIRPDYAVIVDTLAGSLSGAAWIGIASGSGHHPIGWMVFTDDTTEAPSNILLNNNAGSCLGHETFPSYVQDFIDANGKPAVYDPETGEVSGFARISALGAYGFDKYCVNTWGWVKLRGTVSGTGQEYGVTFLEENPEDSAYGKFNNYAFSGAGTDASDIIISNTGFGPVAFYLNITEAVSGVHAWFEALYGDIYSQGGINTTSAPAAGTNATYLILSNDTISGFSTDCTEIYCVIDDYGDLNVPVAASGNIYSSSVGRIDINKLTANGQLINNWSEINNNPLSGQVYYTNSGSDLTSTDSLTFYNGSGNLGSASCSTGSCLGNGTIIVQGDLYINHNITYTNAGDSLNALANIASAAWIVTGDVYINPNVEFISGAFIVLGGTFNTGTGINQLKVNGLVMAKEFNLQRQATEEEGFNRVAEQFKYDGRAFVNTPPGLEDLISTIPELSIATP